MARTADVAIIGGGIIGTCAAYELIQQGAERVVLFDKQNLASGTTAGSAGVVCPVDLGEIYALMNLVGYSRIQQFRHNHGLGYSQWGSLRAVYEPEPFPPSENQYAELFGGTTAGEIYDYEILEQKEISRRYPWMCEGTAQDSSRRQLRGGVLYPNQGFIDPTELVAIYERLATRSGHLEIWRNTPVLDIRTTGDRVSTLVTRRGAWDVGQVLNAAGPWGGKVGALADCDVPITPQRIQVCVATAFDDHIDEVPLTGVPQSGPAGVWCRGETGGTMIFGQHHHTTLPGVADDPDHVNRVNDPTFPATVAAAYRKYWNLPQSQFLNGWCCVYGTTTDGYPVISKDPRLENLYHALGMNGHGIVMHAAVGLAISRLMLHNSTSTDLRPVIDQDYRFDISRLDIERFTMGRTLDFDLHIEDLRRES